MAAPHTEPRAGIVADLPLLVAGGVVTAMPDHIHHRLIRWGADVVVLAAAAATTAVLTDTATRAPGEEPDGGATAPVKTPDDTPGPANPAVLVIGLALLCTGIYADARITRALVGWLRSRGVTRPHTVLGVCTVPILLGIRALENPGSAPDGTMKR
ncbi:hypothetical protein [Corynebacterium sp. TAE3-ERU16]|uniref:hypothetical protein n=1 Tax=Corynebacterium sp. TAE3-ERU16 TaxID=2849493 RepID=UPI001C44A356|nr:hypothetical protein [Corynebacterium sp. TAE3-ERU16]MBV7293483.1 hypothetical protein [Corynebacterium sp. TAE3-ERU16]